jgi:hypothetical protein
LSEITYRIRGILLLEAIRLSPNNTTCNEDEMISKYEPSRIFMSFHISKFLDHDGINIANCLKPRTKVDLRPEPDNPYNPNAIAIYHDDVKLGYVPRTGYYANIKTDSIETINMSGFYRLLFFGHNDTFEAFISSVFPDLAAAGFHWVSVRVVDKTVLQ